MLPDCSLRVGPLGGSFLSFDLIKAISSKRMADHRSLWVEAKVRHTPMSFSGNGITTKIVGIINS